MIDYPAFLPYLPRRTPQSRIVPPPKPTSQRGSPIGPLEPASRCTHLSDIFRRSADKSADSLSLRLARGAASAGRDDPSGELAVERGRNARLTTLVHFAHDRIPARASV